MTPRALRVPRIDAARRLAFGRRLRAWFRASARDLPWRRTRDPYHILVSELMLQQTQVSRVAPRYHEFLAEYPTLAHVARASPERVCESWDGLGYYARARNLHRLACTVTSNGVDCAARLPAEPEQLRRLPGVGAYTAGAVASFAFERRAALVDTNVLRVVGRVFAPRLDTRSARGQKVVWALARTLLPRTGAATWTHNQALMELGALVCTARAMRCGECPVRGVCATARTRPAAQRPSADVRVNDSSSAPRARRRRACTSQAENDAPPAARAGSRR